MYTDYIVSSPLANSMEELLGKQLLNDTPLDLPCTADVLIAMVYHSLESSWPRRALGVITATTGDIWKAIYSERGSMARQPPLSLTHTHRWHQQSIAETFASYFPDEVFNGFKFPYIEDVINLPAFNRYAEWAEGRGIPP